MFNKAVFIYFINDDKLAHSFSLLPTTRRERIGTSQINNLHISELIWKNEYICNRDHLRELRFPGRKEILTREPKS